MITHTDGLEAGERARLTELLREMHTYVRPARSTGEHAFCEAYLYGLPGATEDGHGNIHVQIGTRSRILFSSHTDTVHDDQDLRQRQGVKIGGDGRLRLKGKSKKRSACLGADDTAGVFLMREMILAGVEGYYIFHFGEEIGCEGSGDLAKYSADWLRTNFDAAIAFDRKGYSDVITHQGGRRTASEIFARALSDRLTQAQAGLSFRPCDRGIYTDTREYADLVPECTNLSIGYEDAHSSRESVEIAHVLNLRAACLRIDWQTLPIDRDPVKSKADEDAFWEAYQSRRRGQADTGGTCRSGWDGSWTADRSRSLWDRPDYGGTEPTEASEADEAAILSEIDRGEGGMSRAALVERHAGMIRVDWESKADVYRECDACGLYYWQSESNAPNPKIYCDATCQAFKDLDWDRIRDEVDRDGGR